MADGRRADPIPAGDTPELPPAITELAERCNAELAGMAGRYHDAIGEQKASFVAHRQRQVSAEAQLKDIRAKQCWLAEQYEDLVGVPPPAADRFTRLLPIFFGIAVLTESAYNGWAFQGLAADMVTPWLMSFGFSIIQVYLAHTAGETSWYDTERSKGLVRVGLGTILGVACLRAGYLALVRGAGAFVVPWPVALPCFVLLNAGFFLAAVAAARSATRPYLAALAQAQQQMATLERVSAEARNALVRIEAWLQPYWLASHHALDATEMAYRGGIALYKIHNLRVRNDRAALPGGEPMSFRTPVAFVRPDLGPCPSFVAMLSERSLAHAPNTTS